MNPFSYVESEVDKSFVDLTKTLEVRFKHASEYKKIILTAASELNNMTETTAYKAYLVELGMTSDQADAAIAKINTAPDVEVGILKDGDLGIRLGSTSVINAPNKLDYFSSLGGVMSSLLTWTHGLDMSDLSISDANLVAEKFLDLAGLKRLDDTVPVGTLGTCQLNIMLAGGSWPETTGLTLANFAGQLVQYKSFMIEAFHPDIAAANLKISDNTGEMQWFADECCIDGSNQMLGATGDTWYINITGVYPAPYLNATHSGLNSANVFGAQKVALLDSVWMGKFYDITKAFGQAWDEADNAAFLSSIQTTPMCSQNGFIRSLGTFKLISGIPGCDEFYLKGPATWNADNHLEMDEVTLYMGVSVATVKNISAGLNTAEDHAALLALIGDSTDKIKSVIYDAPLTIPAGLIESLECYVEYADMKSQAEESNDWMTSAITGCDITWNDVKSYLTAHTSTQISTLCMLGVTLPTFSDDLYEQALDSPIGAVVEITPVVVETVITDHLYSLQYGGESQTLTRDEAFNLMASSMAVVWKFMAVAGATADQAQQALFGTLDYNQSRTYIDSESPGLTREKYDFSPDHLTIYGYPDLRADGLSDDVKSRLMVLTEGYDLTGLKMISAMLFQMTPFVVVEEV